MSANPAAKRIRESVVVLLRAAVDAGPGGADSGPLMKAAPAVVKRLAGIGGAASMGQALTALAWHHAALLQRVAALDPAFDLEEYLEEFGDPEHGLRKRLGGH